MKGRSVGLAATAAQSRSQEDLQVRARSGGWVNPASEMHCGLMSKLVARGKEAEGRGGRPVEVAMLQYDLAPHGIYPRQLRQAAAALRYLIEDCGIGPENIILAGDSAGGNLALTLLAHLLQPHPSLAPLSLSRPLKSSVLLSPWVTFSQTSASMKACAQMDYLSLPGLTKGFEAFLGGADVDVWNTPLAGEAGFWKGLEKKVGDVRVLAGGLEIFSDDIGVFVERLKVHNKERVELFVGEAEQHDPPVADIFTGREGLCTLKMFDWMRELTE
ncbi:hypothetical protein B0A50_06363 [Salinomyces thailandicus]|uniref:Alpha/beta hydrolase fold-3 domain-containing protein n=1 Tax=Salinomyces thailandicus TaxID=706561 RepID=A0A4U0TR30_9PEZI|nr:hypothetical protein B0A50_06363 [Salinomyces thailandica]